MRARALEVTTEQRGETRLYSLAGGLFGNAAGYAFQEQVRTAMADDARRIVLGLSDVEKIDSSGVGILVSLMWSASNAGAAFVLAAIPPRIEKVLSLAMLLDHVAHAATVEEGLAIVAEMEPRSLGS